MTVHLVGAGPGDADLLTMKAARLLAQADVVVHDRLVHPSILALANPDARRIDVGKSPGGSRTQAEIDDLLVDLGRTHQRVVRLKGGDPFLFGRGGEEGQALVRAGVDVEVVPGVSSALAAPAVGGIPVTQRGVASAVTIVTGHDAATGRGVHWAALAGLGGTIVVLMGVAQRATIARRLQDAGMSPSTPVAVVEHAGRSRQRTVRTDIAGLGSADVGSPAVIVIGAVAALDVTAARNDLEALVGGVAP